MAEEKKSSTPKTSTSAPASSSSGTQSNGTQNGKGDAPRNCFSDSYRSNFDAIDWSK